MFEANKKLRNSSHETGQDRHCKRHKCLTHVLECERNTYIRNFNNLSDKNAQYSYLAGLTGVQYIVKRRRPGRDEQDASLHDYSYTYKVCLVLGNCLGGIPVCIQDFYLPEALLGMFLQKHPEF